MALAKPQAATKFGNDSELLHHVVVELAPALIGGEGFVAIGRLLIGVPADQHGARLFFAIEPQQQIGEAENGAGRLVALAADVLRQRVIGAVRERVAVDDEQRTARFGFLDLRRRPLGGGAARWPVVSAHSRARGNPDWVPAFAGTSGAAFAQLDPDRRMIAGIVLAANGAIDAGGDKALGGFLAQQQMIDAQAGVARPAVAQVAPVSVHRRVGMQRADGVAPALTEQARETRAAFRLQQRVLVVRFGLIDIAIGRHDIEIAGEHDRHVGGEQIRRMRDQPVHPGELVGEFRSGLRIAVRARTAR